MRRMVQGLSAADLPLARSFDVALLDLDGVVYIGPHAVESAAEALAAARASGMHLAFVTNNAARPPSAVAEHLTALGIAARAEEVVTSAQAAAHYLADRLGPGAPVLVVGTVGLAEALRERGLRPVYSADDAPEAVVQGYSPELDWHQLAEGAVAIRRGVPWIATNLDATVPSPRGPLPGNGSLVAALRHATGVTPLSTGKPDPTMHQESVQRSGAERPIVVGDRLDTDIEGANAVGCPSLLVLTGVTAPRQLLALAPGSRPSFVARDLRGLLTTHPTVAIDGVRAVCGDWQSDLAQDGALELRHAPGRASLPVDDLDPLRALCGVAWARFDELDPAPGEQVAPVCRAADDQAAAALTELGLS